MKVARRYAHLQPLLIAAVALAILPPLMHLVGLTTTTAATAVILAIAATGLNLCVGYTGLVSFGHGAWFGIGAYAAALVQKHWFPGEIVLPILLSMIIVAGLSSFVGLLILRRRGVYFSLLTLAFAALTYTVAFRWSDVTGGEDGLGNLQRGSIGPISLGNPHAYYALIAVIALVVLYVLLRVLRSPFGHVIVAVRENQLRAAFQGYPVERYKLAVFVLSAVVAGLAGALLGFETYLVSAESVSVPFSGELLAMVVIGGMRNLLGPALGALFFILFRDQAGLRIGCCGSESCSSASCCGRRAAWSGSGSSSCEGADVRPCGRQRRQSAASKSRRRCRRSCSGSENAARS
jgi:branched-chain amino acid transport system ATP-binding protein